MANWQVGLSVKVMAESEWLGMTGVIVAVQEDHCVVRLPNGETQPFQFGELVLGPRTRLAAFNDLQVHPWLGRLFAKLTAKELAACRSILTMWANINRGEFEHRVNRLWLDLPASEKPKHAGEMVELMICANSAKEET